VEIGSADRGAGGTEALGVAACAVVGGVALPSLSVGAAGDLERVAAAGAAHKSDKQSLCRQRIRGWGLEHGSGALGGVEIGLGDDRLMGLRVHDRALACLA